MKKTIIKIENAIILILVAISLFAIVLTKHDTNVSAATPTITVNKNAAISVYVSGSGVELVNSTPFVDEYSYETGTEFTISSVNETKIFSKYVITDSTGTTDIPTQKYSASKSESFSISVEGRSTVTADKGSYMGDRFLLEDDEDLIALQEIIKTGVVATPSANLQNFYNQFLGTTTINETNYNKIVNGYFLVANNISMFSSLSIGSQTYYFTGIGTTANPFNGVICGNVDGISSQIVTVINKDNLTSSDGINSFGFFGSLGSNAVVRNLKFATSIGIKEGTSKAYDSVYAGGVAGYANDALLVNVASTANISVDIPSYDTDVYTGIFVGEANGLNIDSISKLSSVRDHASLTVNTKGNNYAGAVAGKATNMYIKGLELDLSGLSIILRNQDSFNSVYGGVLFGYLSNTSQKIMEDIHVSANESFRVEAYSDTYTGTSYTGSYTGGVAGYCDADAILSLGNITFASYGDQESVISSNTMDAESMSNVYSGGLFGYLDSLYSNNTLSYVVGNDEFKDRINETNVDGKIAYSYNPVFTGNISILSTQNGLGDGKNYGKAVAGGLVGKGLIDINGLSTLSSDIVITKEGKFSVKAVQSRIAMHQKIADYISGGKTYNPKSSNLMMLSDYEHCVSSIVFGLISENALDYSFENINIYAEQAISITEREIGSMASGHILNSGFVSYSDGQTIDNVHLYYNNCNITSNSLSYETKAYINKDDTNSSGYDYDNAHVGGIVGSYTNGLNKSIKMSNVSIEGVDWNYLTKTIGTKLKIYSIQNTIPGGGDGRGENYIGGIIGKIYRANIDNAVFRGSSTSEDYIRMSGHEDPDSAFCGGIVGFIKGFGKDSYENYLTYNDTTIGASVDGTISVTNCSVIDTEIYGEATVIDFSEPDIYVGGIIGASYVNGSCSTEFKFNDLSIIRCSIKALGNERTIVYCAGVLGGATWTSNKYAISNCFVSDTVIEATARPGSDTTGYDTNKHAKAYAAGMCSLALNANITFSNNAIIESQITSSNYAGGLFAYGNTKVSTQTKTYINNYSNALLAGENVYGIAPSQTSLSSNNYYHLQNTGLSSASGIGDAIDFSKQQVTTTYDTVVDNINRDTNYMDYQLEYDNGYQVNTGTAVPTYEYRKYITTAEYNNLYNYYLFDKNNNVAYVKCYDANHNYYNYLETYRYTRNDHLGTEVRIAGNGSKLENYSFNNINHVFNFTQNVGGIYIDPDHYIIDYATLNANNQTISDYLTDIQKEEYKYYYIQDSSGNYYFEKILTETEYNLLSDVEKALYTKTLITSGDSTVDNTISFVGDSNLAYVDKLHLWVNFKGVGTTVPYDESKTREELHADGWFDLGSIIVYNKEEGVLTTPPTITDEQVSYVVDDAEYLYDNGVFKNKNYPFDEVSRNGYEITDSYNYVVKVHDDIPSWKLTFKIDKNISLLEEFYEVGSDSSETLIDTSSGTVSTYGSYTFSFITTDTDKIYTLVFNPNVNIEQDAKVVIKFRLGNSLTLDSKIFTLDIKENKFTLVGVKYAEYSPALNNYKYPEVITNDINTSYLEGQYRNDIAYCLPKDQIIKFIPIFKRQNDLVVKLYDDEKYIELVSFNNDVKSSGEWVVSGSGGSITITYTASNTFEFKYTVSSKNQVTYSVIGMTPEAIPYTSPGTDYEFICYLNNGYSGHPKNVTIEIGSTIYSYANNTLGDILEVYDINGNVVSWDMENTYYRLLLDGSKINSDVHISIEFPLVYTVRFDLQTEGFNGTGKKEVKVYKLEDGQLFNDYFNTAMNLEVDNWIKENTIFGYAFTGFYLVAESNTHSSYGINYEDILKMNNFEVHTSFTFYARWSFLVELVEAPGTTITPSFKDSFMTEIDPENYGELVSKTIRVPLNNKEGYVFTVEKDPTYIGEAEVAAYIITKDGDRQVVTEVTVEKYHKDMYLYHIPSEAITGYLMIVTSISNSGFIVGENTATVTEEILPEDGIFTYKYVVNHLKNDTEKSYVYDNGKVAGSTSTLSLNKNFVLYFYEQGYDQTNLVTTKENYNLPNGTYVEVYYQKFVNQVMTERIVATKKINNSSTHYISLDEFYTIDYQKTSDFKNETFNEFLGNNESVSEVYYIVITPPNGYRQHDNEIKNFIVEGGYENVNCYEAVLTEAEYNTISSLLNSNNIFAYNAKGTKRVEITQAQYDSISNNTIKAKFEFAPFIKGIRNGEDFVNKPLEEEQEADFIKYETSRQVKVYSVTPSRITTNTKSGTTYTFTDDKEYQVFNVRYDTNATITLTGDGKKLSLAPNATQDTLISSVLPFNLVSLKFSAGYNTGKIEVYGINGSTRQLMQTVEIDSIEYKDYEVSFIPVDEPTRYNQFELKVVAADEIRLSSLSIVSLTNGMSYSLDDFSKYHQGNTINFSNQIVNDQRHDGKTFMIAVQFKKDGTIVDVPEGVKINVNGTLYNAFVDQDVYGRITAYFNMSKILDGLSGNSFKYSIEGASGYTYTIQLIEAINPNKPAMSEVRGTIE